MTPKLPFPLVGSITGSAHAHTPWLVGGRSPHPLQRVGAVPLTGLPNMGAGGVPGLGNAPRTAGPSLANPPTLPAGILNALMV